MVVADERLGMEEPRLVEADAHAGGKQVAEERAGGELRDGTLVAARREHQTHIDAAQRSIAQHGDHRLGRHEVGGLDIDVATALADDLQEPLHDDVPLVHRPGGDDLQGDGARGQEGREECGIGDELAGRKAPVGEERGLHLADGGTGDADVGVAPDAAVDATAVALGDVHAAQIARAAVDDHHLAVVAAVGVGTDEGEVEAHERDDLHAPLAHAAVETGTDEEVGRRVVEHTHRDALGGLADEQLAELTADGVVLELEELHVDAVRGGGDVALQRGKHVIEGGEHLHVVAWQQRRTSGRQQHVPELGIGCI